jgi:hypothetical protein
MKWKFPFIIILAFILFLTIFKKKENFYMAEVKEWNGRSSYRSNRKDQNAIWRANIGAAQCIQTCLAENWCRLASFRSTNECELSDASAKLSGDRDDSWKTWVKIPDS